MASGKHKDLVHDLVVHRLNLGRLLWAAAFIRVWLLCNLSLEKVRLLFECGFCATWVWRKCGFYSSAASIRVQLLFECSFYSSAASIRVRLLFECGFYSSAAFIHDFTVGGLMATHCYVSIRAQICKPQFHAQMCTMLSAILAFLERRSQQFAKMANISRLRKLCPLTNFHQTVLSYLSWPAT